MPVCWQEILKRFFKKVKDSTYTLGGVDISREKVQPVDKMPVFEDILRELKEIKMLPGRK